MKVRVSVEERVYDVEVDMVDDAEAWNREAAPAGITVPDRVLRPRQPHPLPEDAVVRSPIAGRVAAILAGPAQRIRRHQGVVLLEAMKMEVPIGPAVEGTLKAIHVATGDAVATGQVLFEMVRQVSEIAQE
jgi:biotin carboxyl carrier protein